MIERKINTALTWVGPLWDTSSCVVSLRSTAGLTLRCPLCHLLIGVHCRDPSLCVSVLHPQWGLPRVIPWVLYVPLSSHFRVSFWGREDPKPRHERQPWVQGYLLLQSLYEFHIWSLHTVTLVGRDDHRQSPTCDSLTSDFSASWCGQAIVQEKPHFEFWSFPGLVICGKMLSHDSGQLAMSLSSQSVMGLQR